MALENVRTDDFVEYFLFPAKCSDEVSDQEKDLDLLRLEIQENIVEPLTKDFLWHKDGFQLTSRTSYISALIPDFQNSISSKLVCKGPIPPHLYGCSHYGENIDDEWFIVFILCEITRTFPGTIAKIHDADGEFLLIEAADFLPDWATPERCENRVYLWQGKVLLVDPDNLPHTKLLPDEVKSTPEQFVASVAIQNAISEKLEKFPHTSDYYHNVTVYLPVNVIRLLRCKPQLLAAAVNAFAHRDVIDTKCCRAMKYFPPEDRRFYRIKFTRHMYAQLVNAKYMPDRKTGWNLPVRGTEDFLAHDLGVKIACGFEILTNQARPIQSLEEDKGWHRYLTALKGKQYFGDYLEHSRDYSGLLQRAKDYYCHYRDTMYYSPAIGREILDLMKTSNITTELHDTDRLPDDDDSWLTITTEDLDEMMKNKYGICTATKPDDLTTKLDVFLKHKSNLLDGVEFPQQQLSTGQSMKMTFEADAFSGAIDNILKFVIPDDDTKSDDEMSEYCDDDDDNGDDLLGAVPPPPVQQMRNYLHAMDQELAGTTLGDSFEKVAPDDAHFEDVEDFQPVAINVNALKNMMASYRAQLGGAGPASNLLGPMACHLRDDNDDDDDVDI